RGCRTCSFRFVRIAVHSRLWWRRIRDDTYAITCDPPAPYDVCQVATWHHDEIGSSGVPRLQQPQAADLIEAFTLKLLNSQAARHQPVPNGVLPGEVAYNFHD